MIRHPILRFFAWLVCLACLVAAVAVGLGTAWFWQTFAGQGLYSTSLGRIPADPGSRAIVMDVLGVDAAVPSLPVQVDTMLTIKPEQGRSGAEPADLFIGTGPADNVDGFLAGTSYTVARLVDQQWSTVEIPGRGTPPAPQSHRWTASAQGPAPSVPIDRTGPITVVILNADGSAPVDVRLFLVMVVRDAQAYQAWAIGGAVALIVLAWTFGYVAMVRLAPRPREWTT